MLGIIFFTFMKIECIREKKKDKPSDSWGTSGGVTVSKLD